MTGKVPWEASESTVTNIERRPSSLPRAAAHLSTHAYPQSSTLTLQCLLCRVWLSSSERRLGGALCVDLSTDDEKWDVGVERLIEEIREVTHGERVRSKTAQTTTPQGTSSPASARSATPQGTPSPTPAPPPPLPTIPPPVPTSLPPLPRKDTLAVTKGQPASSDGDALALGLTGLFQKAGVVLSPAQRDAAMGFFDHQKVKRLTELVPSDLVDDFMQVLSPLSELTEARLRRGLDEAYKAEPWIDRMMSKVQELPPHLQMLAKKLREEEEEVARKAKAEEAARKQAEEAGRQQAEEEARKRKEAQEIKARKEAAEKAAAKAAAEEEARKAAEAERLRREAEQEMAHYGVSTAEELDEMKEIEDLFV